MISVHVFVSVLVNAQGMAEEKIKYTRVLISSLLYPDEIWNFSVLGPDQRYFKTKISLEPMELVKIN